MKWVLGIGLGALGGYLWYRVSGASCDANTCPITSNPWISTIYGALVGVAMVFK